MPGEDYPTIGEERSEVAEAVKIGDRLKGLFWQALIEIINEHGGEAPYPDCLYAARHESGVKVNAAREYLNELTSSRGPLDFHTTESMATVLRLKPKMPRRRQ